jgi:hypothetical protein
LTAKVSGQQDDSEPEEKDMESKESLPQSPEPEQASNPEKSGDEPQPVAEKKKTKAQLDLFDLKNKE